MGKRNMGAEPTVHGTRVSLLGRSFAPCATVDGQP